MAKVTLLFSGASTSDEFGASSVPDFIEFDATPQETHSHSLQTTDHPVEEGSDITDHARPKPDTLSLDCCVTDGAEEGRASDIYERLRLLMDSAVLLTVITTVRTYESMLLENLGTTRTAKDFGGLHFTVSFKQISLVQNKTTVVTVTREPITKKKISTGKQPAQLDAKGEQRESTILKGLSNSSGLTGLLGLK